jgi:subtilisin family serine protease
VNIGRKFVAAATGVTLTLTLTVTPTASAAPESPTGSPDHAQWSSVTLITGDRVIRTAGSDVAIRPAKGRERIGFSAFTAGGHRYVVPNDALRPLRTGQLDRRLFDVTLLAESGYDDASRATLPVIIGYQPGVRAATVLAGGTVTRALPSINAVALTADKTNATALWNSVTAGAPAARATTAGVRTVWLDGIRRSTLDHSVPQIGAPAAWAAGYTGTGVKIAVLDSGVDQTHPDLAGREVAERNFSDAADNVDRAGHGTHVASTAAGSGAKAAGRFRGVAFGASLLDGKVLNDNGFGFDSWIIAGMEWAAEQGATVANLSLGSSDSTGIDPLEEAVNTLSAQHGILFVISAGNNGRPRTVGSPGSADAALTVGAVDRADNIAFFSSRGPRVGDGAVKPDITAPGVDIVAAKAAEGTIGDPAQDGYVSLSGTSMAAPHVTGSAALLAQQHPDWTGAQLKAALTASAKPNPDLTPFDQGSGRVDVARAITQTVVSQPTNVSLGTVAWPHGDDQPVTKPLTYRNTGPAAVTLTLAVEAKGPDGRPVPDGVFTLSGNQVTVPAGGQAEVSVTADTRPGTADGFYAGTITATDGTTSVRTPVAVDREVESYNLDLSVAGFDGQPTADYSVLVFGLDNPNFEFPYEADGRVTVRLPKGRYALNAQVFLDSETSSSWAFLAQPLLTVDRDTAVAVDARVARPVSVTPPDPTATVLGASIGYNLHAGAAQGEFSTLTFQLRGFSVAHLGPPLPKEALTVGVDTQWTNPGGDFFGLAWHRFGTLPTGFTKVVRPGDVATVRAEFGSVLAGRPAGRLATPLTPSGPNAPSLSAVLDVATPGARTEYYTVDGVRWQTVVLVGDLNTFTIDYEADSEPKTYQAGRTFTERFLHGPYGPGFPRSDVAWVSRSGDVIDAVIPMFGDVHGNAGFSAVESASTKLFRGGELVGEFPEAGRGFFDVPAGAADYRLTVEAQRPAAFDVTTRLSATWTFRSGHVDGPEPAALPLSAVRFTPRLDAANAAPAGVPFLVPVAVQEQSGALTRSSRLAVDVSYDEGRTWRRAEVILGRAVLLHHPAGAGSVSLRARATDRGGNTVEQTIIRAYKLAAR